MNQGYRTETSLIRASMLRVSKGITALFVCMTLLSGVFVVEAPTFTYNTSTGSITQADSVAYAAPSKATKKKIAAQRKAMKKTVGKTKAIAAKYPDAKKYYTAANKAYKKSAKAKTVASAKKYRATVNKNYKKALSTKKTADAYKKSIKDTYNNIVATAKQAPSLAKYVDASKAQYVRSTKAVKISELKKLKASVVGYYNSAKSAKAKLTWSDAVYEDRWVAEKTVEHPAEWKMCYGSFCVLCSARNGGNVKTIIENGISYPIGKMYLDDEGLYYAYYNDKNGKVWVKSPKIVDGAYEHQYDHSYNHMVNGESSQRRDNWEVEVCTVRAYTETIPAHTERVLVRAAGWY